MDSGQHRMIGNSAENSWLLFNIASIEDLINGWLMRQSLAIFLTTGVRTVLFLVSIQGAVIAI
jgi:hypothetical protein